jgi:hypothetical protein
MSTLLKKLSAFSSAPFSPSVRHKRAMAWLSLALCLCLSMFVSTGCLSRSLTSLQIVPGPGSETVTAGQTAQFKATATYTESGHENKTQDVTSQATWQSANPAVATIGSTGLVTSVSGGTTTITATIQGAFGTVTATSNITVTSAPTSPIRTLTALTVTPGSQTLATAGETAQFIAIGTYNASPMSQNLTSQVTWQSSDTSVAQVNRSGLVIGVGQGSATITALGKGSDGSVVSAAGTISITSAPTVRTLTALTVTPGSQTITSTGQTAQLVAIGTYSAAPLTEDLTGQVTWQSSDTQVAQVSSSGLVTGIGIGQATVIGLVTALDGSVITANGAVTVTTEP